MLLSLSPPAALDEMPWIGIEKLVEDYNDPQPALVADAPTVR
ncbi:MAG: hypothetical protein RQ833_08260 [Sphingomonadaceae bacterium]|nr:hypothetical protein [Sphingomonadaceae bacterium]